MKANKRVFTPNFPVSKQITILIIIVCCFCSCTMQAEPSDEIVKKIVFGGRTLFEISSKQDNGDTVYTYRLQENLNYVKFMRSNDTIVSMADLDPFWTDRKLHAKECNMLAKYCKDIIYSKDRKKANSIKKHYRFLSVVYMLEDNGKTTMYALVCKGKPLFEYYSPEEIISMFDKISRFYFTAPVSRGYNIKYHCFIQDEILRYK